MNTFTSILVDIDATATAPPALERAAEIARKCSAPLRVVDVMWAPAEAHRVLREDLEDELMARRREKLARLAYGLRDVVAETDTLTVTKYKVDSARGKKGDLRLDQSCLKLNGTQASVLKQVPKKGVRPEFEPLTRIPDEVRDLIAERQDEEAGAPVLAGLRVPDHRSLAVVHLPFFIMASSP